MIGRRLIAFLFTTRLDAYDRQKHTQETKLSLRANQNRDYNTTTRRVSTMEHLVTVRV